MCALQKLRSSRRFLWGGLPSSRICNPSCPNTLLVRAVPLLHLHDNRVSCQQHDLAHDLFPSVCPLPPQELQLGSPGGSVWPSTVVWANAVLSQRDGELCCIEVEIFCPQCFLPRKSPAGIQNSGGAFFIFLWLRAILSRRA